jgi:hypothetical protein
VIKAAPAFEKTLTEQARRRLKEKMAVTGDKIGTVLKFTAQPVQCMSDPSNL